MTRLMTRRTALITASAAGASALVAPSLVRAANSFDVEMLTAHPDDRKIRNIFLPRIVTVEPGDTVNFMATDKSHNSASAKGMIPDDVEGWKGKINQDIAVTFEKPGFYGYLCTPHAALGMVGLVVVKGEGMTDNLEAAQGVRQRGKALQAWEEIWAHVAEMELTA